MSVRQPKPAPAATSPTCDPPSPLTDAPRTDVVGVWPVGGPVTCQNAINNGTNTNTLHVTAKFRRPTGLASSQDVTLPLLYIVNGSLDYSALFSQAEISRNGTITFRQGQTEAEVTLLTLPISPNTTFELEVLAYPGRAVTIISGSVQVKPEAAEDKSLKAISVPRDHRPGDCPGRAGVRAAADKGLGETQERPDLVEGRGVFCRWGGF